MKQRILLSALAAFAPAVFVRLIELLLWFPWSDGARNMGASLAVAFGAMLAGFVFASTEDAP